MEINLAFFRIIRILDKKNYCNGSATSLTKNVVFFFTALLALSSGISLQMENID